MNEFAPLVGVGLLLDHLLGEASRFHPLSGFGYLANKFEKFFNRTMSPLNSFILGGVATLLLLALVVVPIFLVGERLSPWLEIFLLYLAVGGKSLTQHGQRVATALQEGNLPAARVAVGMLVSRDVDALNEGGVALAATESVLENGCDAVFGAIFWFLLLGGPGVALYRCSNTLDAMWGYKTEKYLYFGRFAARLDDVLNYIPARLTVLTYALLGNTRTSLRSWRQQGRQWYSPNAGPVMAAGAGALGVQLGGEACYHGAMRQRPVLGEGLSPVGADIGRALRLVNGGAWLWAGLAMILWGLFHG